jgi:hypothetical protein
LDVNERESLWEAYDAQMPVNSRNALVGVGLEQLGCDDLLDGQHDAVLAPDADRGAAVLDGLDGVLDLEIAAIGGEDGVGEVVARAYRRLRVGGSVSAWVYLVGIASLEWAATVRRGVAKRTIVMGNLVK